MFVATHPIDKFREYPHCQPISDYYSVICPRYCLLGIKSFTVPLVFRIQVVQGKPSLGVIGSMYSGRERKRSLFSAILGYG